MNPRPRTETVVITKQSGMPGKPGCYPACRFRTPFPARTLPRRRRPASARGHWLPFFNDNGNEKRNRYTSRPKACQVFFCFSFFCLRKGPDVAPPSATLCPRQLPRFDPARAEGMRVAARRQLAAGPATGNSAGNRGGSCTAVTRAGGQSGSSGSPRLLDPPADGAPQAGPLVQPGDPHSNPGLRVSAGSKCGWSDVWARIPCA